MLPPTPPNLDAVPAPVLKRPDDGCGRVLMPGAGMLDRDGDVGSRPAVALMLIVSGPPTAHANVGTLSTKLGQ